MFVVLVYVRYYDSSDVNVAGVFLSHDAAKAFIDTLFKGSAKGEAWAEGWIVEE
jgi:hypothetical protein